MKRQAAGRIQPIVAARASQAADGIQVAPRVSGLPGFLPLQLAVGHDTGVAIGADLAPMCAARQRLELFARPVVLAVIAELQRIR